MDRPKLNQLEMLVAVADSGGFGRAAAQLGCTQSRVSHAITELEGALRTRLLLRSRSGCVPTDAGHRVIARARTILALADTLLEEAGARTVSGSVRIACFRSVSTHLLPRALEAVAAAYPDIRVDIDDGCEEREEVTRAVKDGRADIGVAQLPVASGLLVRPYVSDSYVVVAPASVELRAPVSWADLSGLPYIQLNCSGALAILEQCRIAGFDARPSRTLATDTSVVAMVAHGIGFSILPHLAVFPAPDGIQVLELPIPARRRFAVVSLAGAASPEPVEAVTRIILRDQVVTRSDAFRAGIVGW
ncbi:MAG: LysR family transcriptional regulator [Pseudomonadota bacterium]